MKVIEAKEQVLQLMQTDIAGLGSDVNLDPDPTPNDPGKFHLEGKRARVIQPYNGFHANINLDWFTGSTDPPEINRETFYWYVFALREGQSSGISTYYICDYHQMREWVLDFDAPEGNDHQDHHDWRGEIQILGGHSGYFRWGDEPQTQDRPERHITLRNVGEVAGEAGAAAGNEDPASGTSSGQRQTSEEASDREAKASGRPFSTNQAKDIGEIDNSTARTEVTTTRVVRDTEMARRIKEHHDYKCQLCGETLELDSGSRYAEAHHIKPLGRPHGGPDVSENILCVCPSCHVRLDYGDRRLTPEDLRDTRRHEIGRRFLAYHNREVFGE
jgi:hypothetical protein